MNERDGTEDLCGGAHEHHEKAQLRRSDVKRQSESCHEGSVRKFGRANATQTACRVRSSRHKPRARFGDKCEGNGGCQSDACIFRSGDDSGYCTKACESFSDCPSFWECESVGNAAGKFCKQNWHYSATSFLLRCELRSDLGSVLDLPSSTWEGPRLRGQISVRPDLTGTSHPRYEHKWQSSAKRP